MIIGVGNAPPPNSTKLIWRDRDILSCPVPSRDGTGRDVGPISVGWDQILMGWDGMGWDVGQDLTAGRDVGLTFTGRDQTSAGRDVPSRPRGQPNIIYFRILFSSF